MGLAHLMSFLHGAPQDIGCLSLSRFRRSRAHASNIAKRGAAEFWMADVLVVVVRKPMRSFAPLDSRGRLSLHEHLE